MSLHWLSANYVLSSLHKLALLILKNSYSHFTDEETEALRSKAACLGHTASKRHFYSRALVPLSHISSTASKQWKGGQVLASMALEERQPGMLGPCGLFIMQTV